MSRDWTPDELKRIQTQALRVRTSLRLLAPSPLMDKNILLIDILLQFLEEKRSAHSRQANS